MHIILASASPRRRALLSELDIPFAVRTLPGIAETYPATLPACDIPLYIAREKAAAYAPGPDELLITADTVVVLDGHALGKPRDEAEACHMLRQLSGRRHEVITGVCLTTAAGQRAFAEHTEVEFLPLTDDDIRHYVSRYRPLDKAGAYGIQEWIGRRAVSAVHGSYTNVMGLPTQTLWETLREMKAV